MTHAALLLLAVTVEAKAQGNSAAPPEAVRWMASVQTEIAEKTTITLGGLYLGGLETPLAFIAMDHALDESWGVHSGYYFASRAIADAPDRRTHFLRVGPTYRKSFGKLTFDNRLLYEAVLDGPARDDGHRLRSRARTTFGFAPEARFQPRLFAYVEPVLDSRRHASRIDFAVGMGGTPWSGWRADVYVLRQTYPDRPSASLSALVVDLQLRLGRRRPTG